MREKKTSWLVLSYILSGWWFYCWFSAKTRRQISFQNSEIKLNFILNAGGLKAFVNFAHYIY